MNWREPKRVALPCDPLTDIVVCNSVESVIDVVSGMVSSDDSLMVWLNMSNGIEAAKPLSDKSIRFGFMRIPSTMLERGKWREIVEAIPDDFMAGLAAGKRQIVIDFGTRKPVPRAIYQGIPIAHDQIAMQWCPNACPDRLVTWKRNGNLVICDSDFSDKSRTPTEKAKLKIRYWQRYIADDAIQGLPITCISAPTTHDGNRVMQRKEFIESWTSG